MNIYLDIDGVLLIDEKHAAPHASEFLRHILSKYPNTTYWLTTHCWKGQNRAKQVIAPYLETDVVKLVDLIKPTDWTDMKTEAIDFSQDFLWLDDDLWPEEMQSLEDNNATGNFIMVDLAKDPDMLSELIKVI